MPFGIGPGELILVLIVALVVFGPRRLPELGSSMGKAIREFRRASSELTREFQQDLGPAVTAAPAAPPPPVQVAAASGSLQICAHCSQQNPAINKYCGGCGKELTAA